MCWSYTTSGISVTDSYSLIPAPVTDSTVTNESSIPADTSSRSMRFRDALDEACDISYRRSAVNTTLSPVDESTLSLRRSSAFRSLGGSLPIMSFNVAEDIVVILPATVHRYSELVGVTSKSRVYVFVRNTRFGVLEPMDVGGIVICVQVVQKLLRSTRRSGVVAQAHTTRARYRPLDRAKLVRDTDDVKVQYVAKGVLVIPQ